MKTFEILQIYLRQLRGMFSAPPRDFNGSLDRLISAERESCVNVCNRIAVEFFEQGRNREAEAAWKCATTIRENGSNQ